MAKHFREPELRYFCSKIVFVFLLIFIAGGTVSALLRSTNPSKLQDNRGSPSGEPALGYGSV